jgi:hypothetical protein
LIYIQIICEFLQLYNATGLSGLLEGSLARPDNPLFIRQSLYPPTYGYLSAYGTSGSITDGGFDF